MNQIQFSCEITVIRFLWPIHMEFENNSQKVETLNHLSSLQLDPITMNVLLTLALLILVRSLPSCYCFHRRYH